MARGRAAARHRERIWLRTIRTTLHLLSFSLLLPRGNTILVDFDPAPRAFPNRGSSASLLSLACAASSDCVYPASIILTSIVFINFKSATCDPRQSMIRAELNSEVGITMLKDGFHEILHSRVCQDNHFVTAERRPAAYKWAATISSPKESSTLYAAKVRVTTACPAQALAWKSGSLVVAQVRSVNAFRNEVDTCEECAPTFALVAGDGHECRTRDLNVGNELQRYMGMICEKGSDKRKQQSARAAKSLSKESNIPPMYAMTWKAYPAEPRATREESFVIPTTCTVSTTGPMTSQSRQAFSLSSSAIAFAQSTIRLSDCAVELSTTSSYSLTLALGPGIQRASWGNTVNIGDAATRGIFRVCSNESPFGARYSAKDTDACGCTSFPRCTVAHCILTVPDGCTRRGVKHEGLLTQQHDLDTPHRRYPVSTCFTNDRKPIIISGGLGGVGRIMSGWIAKGTGYDSTIKSSGKFEEAAKNGASSVAHLVLLGRSGRVDYAHLDAINSSSVMLAMRCDAADRDEASHLTAVTGRRIGAFAHAAGVLADATLPNQNVSGIARVFSPKLAGLIRICAAGVEYGGTETTLLFSSIASLLGSAGQANYAAANSLLDGWAVASRMCGVAGVISVQWGVWNELGANTGMGDADSNTQSRLRRLGLGALTPEMGLAALATATSFTSAMWGVSNLIISPFDWNTFLTYLPSPAVGIFATIAEEQQIDSALLPRLPMNVHPTNVHVRDCSVNESMVMTRTEKVEVVRTTVMSTITRILGHEIDADKALIDAGIDSLSMMELGRAIETDVGVSLPTTIAFDHPTVEAIAAFIADELESRGKEVSLSGFNAQIVQTKQQLGTASNNQLFADLAAVTGFGLRFPGIDGKDCTTAMEFWCLVSSGGDSISVVPIDRWDIDTNTSNFGVHRRRDPEVEEYSRYGSFVHDIDDFDCDFFGVDVKEATAIDPQQRAILKVCVDAMHTGGLSAEAAKGTNTAVYVGICNNDHDTILRDRVVEMMIEGKSYEDVVDAVGLIAFSTYAFASNRASHILGLVGASLSVDCASASALVATHMAALEARRGRGKELRCLAASVNLILHHNLSDLHTARNMFPKDGRCKTFDASADGFERGEGAGAIMAKNFHEVESIVNNGKIMNSLTYPAETERVLAIVRGSATIHKGGGASLRALRGPAIQHKVHMALSDANMTPVELKYIEASGLGEPFGDAIEVGAYQAVFEPSRDSEDALIFGSVHTNIGHLDGCSGMASFIKICLVTRFSMAPPIVHFKSLHPLLRGKSGGETAMSMGHTWSDINMKRFPSAFPMASTPMFSGANASVEASKINRPYCASGASSFGFGGTMVHAIVDTMGANNSLAMPDRLVYFKEIQLQKPHSVTRQRARVLSEETLAYVENVVYTILRGTLGPDRIITRAGHLLEANGTAMTAEEVEEAEARLRERIGAPYLRSGIVACNPSVARLAEAVLRDAVTHQASEGMSIGAVIKTWIESQARRQRIEPERRPSSLVMAPPPKNQKRMIFVFANPRSGSTLTQLILNANPALFAPQELYLLHFYTMDERCRRLAGQELEGWIFEGLRKAVMELRECNADAADKILDKFSHLDTHQIYDILQGWAGERILVDKTPPYVWSIDTLRRTQEIFQDVRYIFVHRHPFSNVASMAKKTIQRDWLSGALDGLMMIDRVDLNGVTMVDNQLNGENVSTDTEAAERHIQMAAVKEETQTVVESALWHEAESLWALGNANVLDFLQNEVPPEHALRLSYEDLVTSTEYSARAMCEVIGVPYNSSMLTPYTATNTSTFTPASGEGGLGAGDPHMLHRGGVDPALADAWRDASPPSALSPFASHVAKRLQYRLPVWKEPTSRVGVPSCLIRLNQCVNGPVIVFVHDVSGEVHFARPLAAALPCAMFGLRITNLSQQMAHDRAKVIPDICLSSLASRYREFIRDALQLSFGDSIIFAGAGPLGAPLAKEMATQQEIAAIDKNSQSSVQSSRSWAIDGCAGEPAVVGLLRVDDLVEDLQCARIGQKEASIMPTNALGLPLDMYALFSVARDEIAKDATVFHARGSTMGTKALDASKRFAEQGKSILDLDPNSFVEGLQNADGFASADAALDYVNSYRQSTSQAEWDSRIDVALRIAKQSSELIKAERPDRRSFSGVELVVFGGAAMSAEVAESKTRVEASSVKGMSHKEFRLEWCDPMAPSHATDFAMLIEKTLLQRD